MDNLRIVDQQERGYGWSAVRTLGTVYQYRELLPSEEMGNLAQAEVAFGIFDEDLDVNAPIEIDHEDYRALVTLCVTAGLSAIDGVQVRREDYWTDLVMGTVIDEGMIPDDREGLRHMAPEHVQVDPLRACDQTGGPECPGERWGKAGH